MNMMSHSKQKQKKKQKKKKKKKNPQEGVQLDPIGISTVRL